MDWCPLCAEHQATICMYQAHADLLILFSITTTQAHKYVLILRTVDSCLLCHGFSSRPARHQSPILELTDHLQTWPGHQCQVWSINQSKHWGRRPRVSQRHQTSRWLAGGPIPPKRHTTRACCGRLCSQPALGNGRRPSGPQTHATLEHESFILGDEGAIPGPREKANAAGSPARVKGPVLL
jgi:hypothetical protein